MSQICRSDIESRHEGIPVILIPFLAIQNNCWGVHFEVESSRYGGCGIIPATHCSRPIAGAPWHATQWVS
jgi:hypothetical protein